MAGSIHNTIDTIHNAFKGNAFSEKPPKLLLFQILAITLFLNDIEQRFGAKPPGHGCPSGGNAELVLINRVKAVRKITYTVL